MLNEERVKHMTKLAFYEERGGSEEIKISMKHKKDYIGFQTFWAGFWFTLAYIAFILFMWITFLAEVFSVLTRKQLLTMIVCLLGIYFILLITYVSKTKKIHKKKHARAFHHAKRFKEELDELEKMYDKEDNNE